MRRLLSHSVDINESSGPDVDVINRIQLYRQLPGNPEMR